MYADGSRVDAGPPRARKDGHAARAPPACRQVSTRARHRAELRRHSKSRADHVSAAPATSRRFAKLEQTVASAEGARVARVCEIHPVISESEARAALALCKNDERRAVRKLRSYRFLKRARKVNLLQIDSVRGWRDRADV